MIVDPFYAKKYQLNRNYGLTWEGFQELIRDQDYRCAICPEPIASDDKNTHVDHDHNTGKVRGILCSNCNRGLGMFKDSVRLLAYAIVYLEEHGKTF